MGWNRDFRDGVVIGNNKYRDNYDGAGDGWCRMEDCWRWVGKELIEYWVVIYKDVGWIEVELERKIMSYELILIEGGMIY